jgi:predicted nucleotidyltransferase
MLQPKLLKKVLALLNENHIGYMVTGSLVSSMQGEPRSTHDVDILVNITRSVIASLVDTFTHPNFYLSESAIEDAIRYQSMFNLLDTIEGDKVDFWILTDDPFDQSRFARKYDENLLGLSMKISTPEDTILMKLRWSNLSGGSEKQFTDALRVYEVQFGNLDINYIESWTEHLQVKELWERLKQEARPII